jgi:hypothetical protein
LIHSEIFSDLLHLSLIIIFHFKLIFEKQHQNFKRQQNNRLEFTLTKNVKRMISSFENLSEQVQQPFESIYIYIERERYNVKIFMLKAVVSKGNLKQFQFKTSFLRKP